MIKILEAYSSSHHLANRRQRRVSRARGISVGGDYGLYKQAAATRRGLAVALVSRLLIPLNPRSPNPSSISPVSSATGCAMTAKTLRNKGRVDYTGGVSREQRAINRRNKPSSDRKERLFLIEIEMRKYHASQEALAKREENLCAIEQQRFGEPLYDGELLAFEEISFGTIVKPGEKTYRTSANVDRDLSSIVVSLALFDGDTMLFACSGIPLPYGTARLQLTRFVTSAHLVRAFKNYRNRDDKLRVSVRLPNNETTDGFLGLYDDDIAIVTCVGLLDVCPIDLDVTATPVSPDDSLLAAGRAYMSGSLMAMHGSPSGICDYTWVTDEPYHMFKAVLGGPLLGKDARFLGMSYEFFSHEDGTVICRFLPLELLRERLDLLGILNPRQIDFRNYLLPTGVSSVVPSGFMKNINRLKSYGYPMPPPLVLECDVRSFACTGFLIKWHGSKATRTVILTSASLVRSHQDIDGTGNKNIDDVDKTLKIEVFLPPNQRSSGTLEFYNLSYNIAIVSVKKDFKAVRRVDIFSKSLLKPSEEVVAIARCTKFGPLMATIGEVKRSNKGSKVVCKGIRVCTCKIKKAGIGGPLINFEGSFVGMNFYDGSGVTPFLPKCKIAQVLRGVIDFPLPSESEDGHPEPRDVGERAKGNWWPVPKTYWYHGDLDADMYDVPELHGRTLN